MDFRCLSHNLRGKYCQICIDHTKASATDALKTTWKRITLKKVEVTDDLTDNKIAKRNYKKC